MFHQFSRSLFICFIAFLLCSADTNAQNSIGVTLNIIPPYSPQFGTYAEQPGKVILLLKNNTSSAQTIYLHVNVTGDNGVSLNTIPGTKTTQPIALQPNQIFQADINTLRDLFTSTKYVYKGVTQADVFKKNGLPEGNYDICIRAYDYTTNAPLSGDAPLGCRNIQVANLEPPIPIKPMADEELNVLLPQSLIFTWTIPSGAEPGTQYKLRIIEMPDPAKNINDAYKSATTPTFFETTLMSNVFVYGPAQPTLVKGRKYAWAVTAIVGPKGTAYKNNGTSEVRGFIFGKQEFLPPVISLIYPADGAKMLSISGIEANKFYFKWDYANPGKQSFTYEDVIMVEVKPGQDAKTAFLQNSRVNTTNEPFKKTMFNYTGGNPDGKTFAWYVTLNDGEKTYKSDFRTFTVNGEAQAPVITLSYPADGAAMPSIAGIDANKFYFKWDYSNPANKSFYEDVIMVELKSGQTVHDAIQDNTRVNSTNEPNKKAMFNYTGGNPDGKTFVWYVKLTVADKTYISDFRTFTVKSNISESKAVVKEFNLCGYPVTVTSITDKGGFTFVGNGVINLYDGGKEVPISFDNLVIQPFSAKPIIGKLKDPTQFADKAKDTTWELNLWQAVSGEITDKIFKSKINFENAGNVNGAVWFDVELLKFIPSIKSHYDAKRRHFIEDGKNDAHGVQITGTFNWQTEFLFVGSLNVQQYALYTQKITAKFDYTDLFGKAQFNPLFKVTSEAGVIPLLKPKGITIKLVPTLTTELRKKKPMVHFSFDGYCDLQGNKEEENLIINFTNQKDLVFTVPVDKHTVILTNDKAITASFDAAKVDLNGNASSFISIPSLDIVLTTMGKPIALNYKNAYFKVLEGVACNGASDLNSSYFLSDFLVALNKSKISIQKSKLVGLNIDGNINVPFVNQKGSIQITADENGLQGDAAVSIASGTTTMVYQDVKTGDVCDFRPNSGTLKNDRIIMNGTLTLYNTKSFKIGYLIKNIETPDFYVRGNGDVGMMGDNSFVNQPQGSKYNDFEFTPFSMQLSHTTSGYKLSLSGMLVLADNLASSTEGAPNFTTAVAFPDASNKGEGQSKSVSIGSSYISGICPNKSVCDVNGKFTYFDDNTGKGFKYVSDISMTQPAKFDVHAKMIVAKAPEGFHYWFIEAGADNVAEVPTGVLGVVIYGFTGRVYYKMKHAGGNNIDQGDYVPDDGSFLGIYALTKLKTQPDEGVLFWGQVSFEVLTTNSGLGSICFRGSGDLMSNGVDKAGMIKAESCTLNFDWQKKDMNGNFAVSANFMDAVTASADAGFDITPESYHFWGNASFGQLFGNSSFGMNNFGVDLNNQGARLFGDFSLITIHKDYDFFICDPSIDIISGIQFDANVIYSPFQFTGSGTLYGKVDVAGCHLHGSIGLSLVAQVMFPQPTCVSAGITIETPLKDFSLSAGIKNGGIIFDNCF